MEKHDVSKLEAKIKEVASGLSGLSRTVEPHAQGSGLLDLITIIHKPGWTTIADGIFVNGILDSMASHTRTLASLQEALMTGARAVGQK